MKFSRIAARIMVGVFFALVFAALVPFFTGQTAPLQNVYLNVNNKMGLVAPLLLLLIFVVLLVLCTLNKYQKNDLNWLLILNILILIIYGFAVFVRIRQIIG